MDRRSASFQGMTLTMVLASACMTLLFATQAQTYPTRAIRLIVGSETGGSVDATAREVARPMSEGLG